MTRLSLRYSVDFQRLPVWQREKPAPGSEDDVLARRLIGSWEGQNTSNQTLLSGVETYWADGRFQFTGTITRDGQTSAVSVRGTWRIESKKLRTRRLQTSGPTANPAGRVDGDEIVTLTDDEKTLRDSLGHLKTCRKIRK